MGRLHHHRATPSAALTLLPFLDIVFSTIGVFIIVFVLHEVVRHKQKDGRQSAIDSLIICTSEQELTLYLTPQAEPRPFAVTQLPLVFDTFTAHGRGIRNLVFAFSRDCIGIRQQFEETFAQFTALRQSEQDRAAVALRLTFYPLAAQPAAAAPLLDAWRGGPHDRSE